MSSRNIIVDRIKFIGYNVDGMFLKMRLGMQYFFLILIALMWSFTGTLVKIASQMVDSQMITFCRFFFGVIFLLIIILARKEKVNFYWRDKWIWIGVLAKSSHYLLENIAMVIGFVYLSVLVLPVQALYLTIVSIFFFKEEMHTVKVIGSVVCLIGIGLVSWNGLSVEQIMKANVVPIILYSIAAIGAGTHAISQKKLIIKMDSANFNISIFIICSIVTAIPAFSNFHLKGNITIWAVSSLIALGLTTGLTFFLYANILKKVPFLVASFMVNLSCLFIILWSHLFFHEPISYVTFLGAISFLIGLVLLNLPKRKLSIE